MTQDILNLIKKAPLTLDATISKNDSNIIEIKGAVDYTIVCDNDVSTVWWEINHQDPQQCREGEIGDFESPAAVLTAIIGYELKLIEGMDKDIL